MTREPLGRRSSGGSLSPEEKKQKRQEASRPILDAFWSWVEETSALHTTNTKLTEALTYASNQKKYLETFMEEVVRLRCIGRGM